MCGACTPCRASGASCCVGFGGNMVLCLLERVHFKAKLREWFCLLVSGLSCLKQGWVIAQVSWSKDKSNIFLLDHFYLSCVFLREATAEYWGRKIKGGTYPGLEHFQELIRWATKCFKPHKNPKFGSCPLGNVIDVGSPAEVAWELGHIIGERKKYIFYGECYLSAIMHKKMEFGLKKSKKWIFTL